MEPPENNDDPNARLNERLLRAGISMSLEGDEPNDETAILIDELLLRLESARAEVDHLTAANATLRKGRKREASPAEEQSGGQRPPKRRDVEASETGGHAPSQTQVVPREGSAPPYTSNIPAHTHSRAERPRPPPQYANAHASSSSRQVRHEPRASPLPYDEDVRMDMEPFVERGYGPPTSITMPNAFPPPPKIATDDTIERMTPAHDSDADSSDDTTELWDEDPQQIANENKGKWPSETELARRRAHNSAVEAKREKRAKALAERRREAEMQMPGRIPDGLGVVRIPPSNSVERDNAMRGMWSRRTVYYSARTNMVFVGQSAAMASQYKMQHTTGYRPPQGHALYSRVPRGVPRTPAELDRLMSIAANVRIDPRIRTEAYGLLIEFRTVTERMHPRMWDRTMSAFMISGFDQSYQPDVEPGVWDHDPIQRDLSRAIVGNPANASRGVGMSTPALHELMNMDTMGRYVLLHGRPGSPNPYLGVVMDHMYRIHRRSLFGYGLGRMLAPSDSFARTAFMRLFAVLTASPFRYRDAVANHNANNPGAPMHPQAGPTFQFQRLQIDRRHVQNMTIEDVISALIFNRVPVDWVDHAYLFGLQFFDQHYAGNPIDEALLADHDNERLHRLDLHGAPPAIPAWDGWRHPTEDEILRLNIILELEEQRGIRSLYARGWFLAGESPYRRYLTGRSRTDADAGLAAYRQGLMDAAAAATAAPAPPPPQPAVAHTSSSSSATANTVADPAPSLVNANDTTLDEVHDTAMEGAPNEADDNMGGPVEPPLSPLSNMED